MFVEFCHDVGGGVVPIEPWAGIYCSAGVEGLFDGGFEVVYFLLKLLLVHVRVVLGVASSLGVEPRLRGPKPRVLPVRLRGNSVAK